MMIVLAAISSEKVVLSSTYPRTSTWSPVKPTKHPSYGLSWSWDNYRLMNVPQNITSVDLPWSIKTLRTFLPMVTTNITIRSFSWGTTSSRSELAKQRVGSRGWSALLTSRDITACPYHLRLEAKFPPSKNPLDMVISSPWTGISCAWSLKATSPFGLVSLKIILQEPFLHQASQLVAQSYASLDIMPICLVELTPGISPWSQIPICLLRKLQFVYYPWHTKKFFVGYSELGPSI